MTDGSDGVVISTCVVVGSNSGAARLRRTHVVWWR